MIKLMDILREQMEGSNPMASDREAPEKNILTSNPDDQSTKKFVEISQKVYKHFVNPQIVEKKQFHNHETDSGFSNMLKPSTLVQHNVTQCIGEYEGQNFKGITEKLAQLYEKAGFTVEEGYGMDDIKGFEVKTKDGEVVGEVDFLEKDSIPNHGHTIIIKYKKQK